MGHSSTSRKAEVEKGGPCSSENRWTLGFQVAEMETPHRRVNPVDPYFASVVDNGLNPSDSERRSVPKSGPLTG
ncbi:jg16579 [Pararge aegeria aegeria]|uniref:Jg16579 protein n=1 Tax=Pararge aegeria aegeria TaxID=348720 RepID=A0A8S4R7Z4_9NEOP|nr:jg16579 [Pararge aegeria aegeria]